MNRDDPRPAYVQIADSLREAIQSGQYAPGQRLPTGKELAAQFGVAYQTVQDGLKVLKSESLVIAMPPRGTFVAGEPASARVLRGIPAVAESLKSAGGSKREDASDRSAEYLEIVSLIKDIETTQRRVAQEMSDRISQLEAAVGIEAGSASPSASAPEHQPVVAAVVVSERGVLVGKRRDGRPPWTFIAGEIEPGESAVDAAVREVKEEAGLEVRAASQEIGRRVHPFTGRTMVYLSCEPVKGTEVFVGDADELSEVRWATLSEVDTLLPGVFPPVRQHLEQVIGSI